MISMPLFSQGLETDFFQYSRLSTPHICVISRSFTENLICSRRRAPVLSVTWGSGATPRSPDYKSASQDASCHNTSSQATQNCAAPPVESQDCSEAQDRLHYTAVCTGFCSAQRQMPLCSRTYASTGNQGLKSTFTQDTTLQG